MKKKEKLKKTLLMTSNTNLYGRLNPNNTPFTFTVEPTNNAITSTYGEHKGQTDEATPGGVLQGQSYGRDVKWENGDISRYDWS